MSSHQLITKDSDQIDMHKLIPFKHICYSKMLMQSTFWYSKMLIEDTFWYSKMLMEVYYD